MRCTASSAQFPYATLFRSFATGMTMEPVVVEDDKLALIVRKLSDSSAKSIEIAAEDVDLSGIEVTDGDAQPEVVRSEEHTSELQSHVNLVCRLLLEKKTH